MDSLRHSALVEDDKNPAMAAVFAALPGIIFLVFIFVFKMGVLPSPIYGALGMIYVDRLAKGMLFYFLVVIASVILSYALFSAPVSILNILFIAVYQFVVLPIWAYKVAKEEHELDNEYRTSI